MTQVRVLTDVEQFDHDHRLGIRLSLGFWLKCEICLRQERGLRVWMRRVPFEMYIPTDGTVCEDGTFIVARLAGPWVHTMCRHCVPTIAACETIRGVLTPNNPKGLLTMIGLARHAARAGIVNRPWDGTWRIESFPTINGLDPLQHIRIS